MKSSVIKSAGLFSHLCVCVCVHRERRGLSGPHTGSATHQGCNSCCGQQGERAREEEEARGDL